uniref:Uncharacterized protein n=1 Tax=Coccidioides posadasii RMSCC 3488 TaxID=454284 RepID=A0A0J6F9G4_COCPO|nr:hypothetical protein CPAG_03190 [Coccidioides posadasii RMSCC 3488]
MSNISFAVSSQQANVPNPSTVPAGEPQLNHDLSLEPGGLYVVLFRMAKPGQYHWSLVVAANERTGMMYHNTNLGGAFSLRSSLASTLAQSNTLFDRNQNFESHCLRKRTSLSFCGRARANPYPRQNLPNLVEGGDLCYCRSRLHRIPTGSQSR